MPPTVFAEARSPFDRRRRNRVQPAVSNGKTMPFDPSTLVARTNAGDAELITPTHGLALGQRRLLSQLENPRAFDELVAEHRHDLAKAERDLLKLAQRGLITLLMPSPQMPVGPAATVVIGGPRRRIRWPLLVGGVAMAFATYAWFAMRSPLPTEKPGERPAAAQISAPSQVSSATAIPSRANGNDTTIKRN
jgi:hypothetical protein